MDKTKKGRNSITPLFFSVSNTYFNSQTISVIIASPKKENAVKVLL